MGVREESKDATRRLLLDATVSALVEVGYRGTTTLEVQRRAGVSRGALLHHFGSRTALILAAIDHVMNARLAEVTAAVRTSAPRRNRLEWALRQVWSNFDGPLFYASLELWAAARSDAELLEVLLPQERVVGHAIHGMVLELFGPELTAHPNFEVMHRVIHDSMRGAAARSVLRTDGTDDRLIADWATIASAILGL